MKRAICENANTPRCRNLTHGQGSSILSFEIAQQDHDLLQGVLCSYERASPEMVPAPRQEQERLEHLIGMSAQGDHELSVRSVLCLEPIPNGSLVRSCEGNNSLYRRMRLIEFAV